VEPDQDDRALLFATLTRAGLCVTAVDSFASARASLVARPPSLLVTELRLGSYNGLHLAFLGREVQPQIAVLVTSGLHDPGLQRDAEALGATFLRKPIAPAELLAALDRAASPRPDSPKRERRCGRRQRDIASFLLLEALRR
jgi:DNA-binding NtrC family response regulator